MDWTSFTKSINIYAKPADIYPMLATRAGMESWFLRLCEYTEPGGKIVSPDHEVKENYMYHFRWHGWDDSVEEKGKILKTNGKDLFEFTFNGNGATNMIVEVRIIAEDEKESIVSLHQYNIPTDDQSKGHWYVGCLEGWTFYLANLKSILEGGIDLRNKNPKVLKYKVINS